MHFRDGVHLDPPIWYEDYFKIKTSEQTVAKEIKSNLNVSGKNTTIINPFSRRFTTKKETDHWYLEGKLHI